MSRKWEDFRRGLQVLYRVAAGTLALFVVVAVALGQAGTLDMVTVRDTEGDAVTVMTSQSRPEEIMQLAGFTAGQYDRVEYKSGADNTASVVISRAFNASITADGDTHTGTFLHGTVADLLDTGAVALGEEDFVEPALDTELSPGLEATVHRVTYAEETRQVTLDEEAVAAYEATLEEDHPFVRDGLGVYEAVYRDRMIDGLVESSELVSLTPTVTPRPADSYDWTEGVPLSRIEGFDDVEMGVDGLPVNYSRLWEGAVCTAYSSSGGRGASGLGLYCGTVAVNPNVIPYGTRMFIVSRDRSFIYGFAIATDTGTAMMQGHVGLDLYFEYNPECYRFGKRQLDVYILD